MHYQRPEEEIPETITELLLYLMLLFQQHHWGRKRQEGMSLSELVKDTEMLQHIKEVSTIAFQTLQKKEVIFKVVEKVDTINSNLTDLEKMGFLVRVENTDKNMIWYEFRHLVLQEILSSIHMLSFDKLSKEKCFIDKNLQACIPLLVGLERLLSQKNTTSITEFVDNMCTKFHFEKTYRTMKTEFFNGLILRERNICSRCVNEYQDLTQETVELLRKETRSGKYYFFLEFRRHHHHQQIYFMAKLLEYSIPINLGNFALNSYTIMLIKPAVFERLINHLYYKKINVLTIHTKDFTTMDLLSPYIESLRKSTVSIDNIHLDFSTSSSPIASGNKDSDLILESLSHILNKAVVKISNASTTRIPVVTQTFGNIIYPILCSDHFKPSPSCQFSIYSFPVTMQLIESLHKFKRILVGFSYIQLDAFERLNEMIEDKKSLLRELELVNVTIYFNDSTTAHNLSSKYLEKFTFQSSRLKTISLYKILQEMFSDDSRLKELNLCGNDFSVRVSEEEEEIMRNHLKSFDYISCTREFTINLDFSDLTLEVFQPLLEMLKFNVSIRVCKELNNDSFKEEILKKASEWKDNNTRVLFRNIDFSHEDKYTNLFDISL